MGKARAEGLLRAHNSPLTGNYLARKMTRRRAAVNYKCYCRSGFLGTLSCIFHLFLRWHCSNRMMPEIKMLNLFLVLQFLTGLAYASIQIVSTSILTSPVYFVDKSFRSLEQHGQRKARTSTYKPTAVESWKLMEHFTGWERINSTAVHSNLSIAIQAP